MADENWLKIVSLLTNWDVSWFTSWDFLCSCRHVMVSDVQISHMINFFTYKSHHVTVIIQLVRR